MKEALEQIKQIAAKATEHETPTYQAQARQGTQSHALRKCEAIAAEALVV